MCSLGGIFLGSFCLLITRLRSFFIFIFFGRCTTDSLQEIATRQGVTYYGHREYNFFHICLFPTIYLARHVSCVGLVCYESANAMTQATELVWHHLRLHIFLSKYPYNWLVLTHQYLLHKTESYQVIQMMSPKSRTIQTERMTSSNLSWKRFMSSNRNL